VRKSCACWRRSSWTMLRRRRSDPLEVSLNLVSSGLPSPLRKPLAPLGGCGVGISSSSPSRGVLWNSCARYVADYGQSARLVPDGDGFKRASHWDTAIELDECGLLASRHSGLEGGHVSTMAQQNQDEDPTDLESVRTSLGSVADGPQDVVRECCEVASEIIETVVQDDTRCDKGGLVDDNSGHVDHRLSTTVARFSFLGPNRAVTLAAELMDSKLRMLELEGNYITSLGVRALAPALKTMGALRYVGLSWNAISDEAVEELMLALSKGKCALSFVDLDLSNNRICNAGVKVLTKALPEFPALQRLSVQHNFFDMLLAHRLVDTGKRRRVKVQINDETSEGRGRLHHERAGPKHYAASRNTAYGDLEDQHSLLQNMRGSHATHAAAGGSGANAIQRQRRYIAKSASDGSVSQHAGGKRSDAQVGGSRNGSDAVTSVVMPVRRPGKSDAAIVPVRFPEKAAQAMPGRVFSKTTVVNRFNDTLVGKAAQKSPKKKDLQLAALACESGQSPVGSPTSASSRPSASNSAAMKAKKTQKVLLTS